MRTCPVCHATNVRASHRQGWMERSPLSWVGVLPFRCGSCQTRYRSFAYSEVRRRREFLVSVSDEVRPPRWTFRIATRVTIQPSGGMLETLDGEIENTSLRGVRVRLPREVPVGSHLSLTLQEGSAREGVVRWTAAHEISGYLHGIEMDKPLERHAKVLRPLARLRCRLFFRRILLGSIAFGLIALAAAGMVWLLEAMHAYNPQYYEPKDMERERFEVQRLSDGAKSQPPPR
jgi:hypothetical protein